MRCDELASRVSSFDLRVSYCFLFRKLAERLYKVLCKESKFDIYLKKYLEKDQILKIKKTLRLVYKK
jgi:uncharacterized membrane protein YbaN (DUF454 family)